MPRGRRRSAVADAEASGAAAENVQEGIDELLGAAARNGPPAVPDDLGNFKPDAADQPAAKAPRVVRRREPEHLTTVREEEAARAVARGEAPPPGEEADEPTADDVTPAPGGAAPAGVFGDEGADDQPISAREQELVDRLAEFERRELERDARLNEALARFTPGTPGVPPGMGAAGPGSMPGAADPRVQALAARLRPENLNPWRLDEATVAKLGGPETAQTIDAMFRVFGSNMLQLMVEAYTLDQEANRAQQHQATQAERSMAQVAQAFYTAHPQLEQYADVVNMVSKELADRYPQLRQQPAEWIRHSAHETYRRLQGWGVSITPTAGGARATAGGIGAPGTAVGRRVAPIRPAPADFGGRSSGNGGRKPLTPLQQEMLDLARYA